MLVQRIASTPPAVSAMPSIPTQIEHRLPDMTRSQSQRLGTAIETENRLVGEAVTKLGGTPVPVTRLSQLEDPVEYSSGSKPDRAFSVPLGTGVSDAPGSTWTVTGAKDGQLLLARANPQSGAVETARKGFAELADHSVALVENYWKDATGKSWLITANPDEVGVQGRSAKSALVDMEALLAAQAADAELPESAVVKTTWGSILDDLETTKRTPKATPATAEGAVDLRRLVGDQQLVLSGVATSPKPAEDLPDDRPELRRVLVATDTAPEGARAALEGANAVKSWFKDKTGMTFWPKRDPLVIDTDNTDFVANAAAWVSDPHQGERQFDLYEGPRDESIRQSVLKQQPAGESGTLDQLVRKYSNMVKKDDEFVRYHEAGHLANGTTWSHLSAENADVNAEHDPVAPHETAMLDEAFADLFGMARTGKTHTAVRNQTSLRSDWSSLDRFRQYVKAQGEDYDEHDGTQLITKPMAGLMKALGKDALADITGGADQRLAAGLSSGDLDVVDIPTAAKALYEAAASRHGEDAPAVRQLHADWAKLGVL